MPRIADGFEYANSHGWINASIHLLILSSAASFHRVVPPELLSLDVDVFLIDSCLVVYLCLYDSEVTGVWRSVATAMGILCTAKVRGGAAVG